MDIMMMELTLHVKNAIGAVNSVQVVKNLIANYVQEIEAYLFYNFLYMELVIVQTKQ